MAFETHKAPASIMLAFQDKKNAEFFQKHFLQQVDKDLAIDLDEIRTLTETVEFDPVEMDKVSISVIRYSRPYISYFYNICKLLFENLPDYRFSEGTFKHSY